MGNAITKNYEVVGDQIASAGLWKIYKAIKRTTGQEVSVFIFEKNIAESITLRRQAPSKRDQERVYTFLKNEASQLSRLRHPCMLEVVEPVDESRTAIAFATEPIFASLSNLLGHYEHPFQLSEDIRKFELDELEVQKGLLQVGKGLQFCHNDAKIVHGNLVPDAIFVNAKGDWKIAGFGFSTFLSRDPSVATPVEYWDYDPDLHSYCQKDLNYQAPEYIIDQKLDPSNDMFGLGCLAYSVLNKGTPLFHTRGNLNSYRQLMNQIGGLNYDKLPSHLPDAMRRLITRDPGMRMNAIEFQSSKFFDNILVSTMRYMETFAEKTRDDKSQFMKGLLRVLPQFPERVLYRKILPCLLEELKDHALLPFTLPNVFYIIQKMTPKEFEEKVLPALKPIFLVREPVQNLLTLLEKIELLQQKATGTVFKEDIMPLVYCALDPKNPPSVQEKALRTVPAITEALDYTTVKASLFPRIATLFAQTTTLTVKVSTLLCFMTLMKILDKFTMTEKLIPLLRNIKTREITVTMATLQVYQEMGKYVDKEVIGTSLLPHLWHLALGPNLKVEQFETFMATINELSTKVHQQHLRHLQDLKKLEDQTKSFAASTDSVLANGGLGGAGGSNLNDFEKLVAGGSGGGTPTATRRSSTENPFKIASDNPFSPNGKMSTDSSNGSSSGGLDMFGDMAVSLPVAKPMSLSSNNSFSGATSAMRPAGMGFGATPTSSSTFNNTVSTSNRTSMNGSHFPPVTSPVSQATFTIPPLSKPLAPPLSTNSSSSSVHRPSGMTFSQPLQKPAGTPPLSHTLGNLSTGSTSFGGFQSAITPAPTSTGLGMTSMTPMSTSKPMGGGMGGSAPNYNLGSSFASSNSPMSPSSSTTLTPSRPGSGFGMASTGAPMAPMTPLQPLTPSTFGGAHNKTPTQTGKKGNSDLGMFDPFS